MDLGGGHEIEFVMAPNLHWPDTMFTFDHATGKPFKVDRITVLLLQIQRRCVSVLSHGKFFAARAPHRTCMNDAHHRFGASQPQVMRAAGVMFTCDAFGAHYCTDDAFDTELEALAPHYRFYYDCLMCAWPHCLHPWRHFQQLMRHAQGGLMLNTQRGPLCHGDN